MNAFILFTNGVCLNFEFFKKKERQQPFVKILKKEVIKLRKESMDKTSYSYVPDEEDLRKKRFQQLQLLEKVQLKSNDGCIFGIRR